MSRFCRSAIDVWHLLIWRIAIVTAMAATGLLAPVAAEAREPDCFKQLERERGSEIVCEFPTRLTAEEQKDLRRITREMLQDARCVVAIRVERSLLDAALGADDHVITVPPQPVRCEVKLRESTLEITGTFTPRVVFVAGLAVEATPGLGEIKGVSPVIAWPVVQYVNRAGNIRSGMLTVINAYRARLAMRDAPSR